MSTRYKFSTEANLHFVSFATVGWVDVFTRPAYCELLTNSLQHCIQHKGLRLYGWCIMPSHVHLVFAMQAPYEPSAFLRDFKRHTSEQMHKAIRHLPGESRREWMLPLFQQAGTANSNNRGWQFWQQDNHPIALYTEKVAWQKLRYLHQNPVAARFVDRAEDWVWSSARDYCGLEGAVKGLLLLEPAVGF